MLHARVKSSLSPSFPPSISSSSSSSSCQKRRLDFAATKHAAVSAAASRLSIQPQPLPRQLSSESSEDDSSLAVRSEAAGGSLDIEDYFSDAGTSSSSVAAAPSPSLEITEQVLDFLVAAFAAGGNNNGGGNSGGNGGGLRGRQFGKCTQTASNALKEAIRTVNCVSLDH